MKGKDKEEDKEDITVDMGSGWGAAVHLCLLLGLESNMAGLALVLRRW